MAVKTVVVFLVGLALASVHPAEAQQQAKVPKVGWLGARSASAPESELGEPFAPTRTVGRWRAAQRRRYVSTDCPLPSC
jgi:hypothetical protein